MAHTTEAVPNIPPLRVVGSAPADRADRACTDGFDALYEEEWSGLVALGWSLTGSWSVAEELAQDACTDAFRRWQEVGGLERPGAWLRRAVLNRAASHHRHRGIEHRVLSRVDAGAAVEVDGPSADRTGDRATDRVADPAFWAAVRSLPERQAACVALHYLEDLPVAEIATILGCRAATVKVHLHRGRTALARRLAALTDTTTDGSGPHPSPAAAAPSEDLAEESR